MAAISRRRLAETVVRLLHEQPARQADILRSLAAYLIDHKQTKQLDLLIKDVARELQQSEGTLLAEARTAFPLDQDGREALTRYLRQQTAAKAVELEERVDPTLLSGMVLRTADEELDTSAHRALQQLASLNSGGKH